MQEGVLKEIKETEEQLFSEHNEQSFNFLQGNFLYTFCET